MQEASGGEKINSPPRWAALAGLPSLGQPDTGPAGTSGPVLAQTEEVVGLISAQIHFGPRSARSFIYFFIFGLSPAHLFGPAQPELFLYYLLYIIYYNVLIYVCICE